MLGQRRPLLLGVLFALTLATRATAALGVVWCAAEMLFAAASWRRKLCSLAALGLPLLVAVVLLLLYNYARFGNALDQGYRQQLILPWAAANRDQGILSLRHLPCNLYYLLLAAPEIVRQDTLSMVLKFPYVAANPWGMSLFLTSPCFVCLFGLRRLDATARWLLLTVLIIATPLLLYFATGYTQFGYRYSLDFLPLLYYLLLRHLHKTHGGLTTAFKVVLLATAFWNLYLFAGYYNWRAGPVPQ